MKPWWGNHWAGGDGLALGEGKSLSYEKGLGASLTEGYACSLQQRSLSHWLAGHVQRGQKGNRERGQIFE